MKAKLTSVPSFRAKTTQVTKTTYLLLDMAIKFLVLYPLWIYMTAYNYETVQWFIGALAASWIAASALLVLGKILFVGIKTLHSEA